MTPSKIAYLFVCLGLTMSVVSCKKKQETDDIVVDKIIEKPQDGPINMGNDERTGIVKWISGSQYTYIITRTPSDSLKVVTNHDKDYHDNKITLVVKRPDGTEFFRKTFTKKNFENVLSEDAMKTGVLTAMALDKAEGNELHFAVTVGSPDENNEENFLVTMILDNLGNTKATVFQGSLVGAD